MKKRIMGGGLYPTPGGAGANFEVSDEEAAPLIPTRGSAWTGSTIDEQEDGDPDERDDQEPEANREALVVAVARTEVRRGFG